MSALTLLMAASVLALKGQATFGASSGTIPIGSPVTLSATGLAPSGQVYNNSSSTGTLPAAPSRGVQVPATTVSTIFDTDADGVGTSADFTIEGWFNLNAATGNIRFADFSKATSGTNRFLIIPRFGTAPNRLRVYVGSLFYEFNFVPVTGKWYHIALAYDGAKATNGGGGGNDRLTLYVNGSAVSVATYPTATFTLVAPVGNDYTTSYLGATSSSSSVTTDIRLDDVRLWDDALTSSTIAGNYLRSLASGTSLVASYLFEGNTNSATGSNNGTAVGSLTYTAQNLYQHTITSTANSGASGTPSASESQVVTPTAAGTYNYTLASAMTAANFGGTAPSITVTGNPQAVTVTPPGPTKGIIKSQIELSGNNGTAFTRIDSVRGDTLIDLGTLGASPDLKLQGAFLSVYSCDPTCAIEAGSILRSVKYRVYTKNRLISTLPSFSTQNFISSGTFSALNPALATAGTGTDYTPVTGVHGSCASTSPSASRLQTLNLDLVNALSCNGEYVLEFYTSWDPDGTCPALESDTLRYSFTYLGAPSGNMPAYTASSTSGGCETAANVEAIFNNQPGFSYRWHQTGAPGSFSSIAQSGTSPSNGTEVITTTGSAAGAYTYVIDTLQNSLGCVLIHSATPSGPEQADMAITVEVESNPVASHTVNGDPACSGASIDVTLSGGTTYGWSYTVSGGTVTGTGDFASDNGTSDVLSGSFINTSGTAATITFDYTVTGANGCDADNSFTLTIYPAPTVGNLTTTVCSDEALGADLLDNALSGLAPFGLPSGSTSCNIHLTEVNTTLTASAGGATAVPGVFTPTTHTISTSGSGENGEEALANDAWTNTGLTDATVAYTFFLTEDVHQCVSDPFTLTATIQPEPVSSDDADTLAAPVCSGSVVSGATLPASTVTSVATADYRIDNISMDAGITANGANDADEATVTDLNGNIFYNSGVTNGFVTFSLVPRSAAGCEGDAFDYVIEVRPAPAPSVSIADNAICNGETVSASVSATGSISSVDTWEVASAATAPTFTFSTVTPTAGSGSGPYTLPAAAFGATAPADQGYVVKVTMTVDGCSISDTSGTITVNYNPTVTLDSDDADDVVCSDAPFNVTATTTPANAVAVSLSSWTINAGAATGTPSANNLAISGINNVTSANVSYTFTALAEHGECSGALGTTSAPFAVQVSPEPVGAAGTASAVCSDAAMNVDPGTYLTVNDPTGTETYSWVAADNANTTGESTTPQTGTIDDVVNNVTSSVQNIAFTVTPTSQYGCEGDTYEVTVPVNPEPDGDNGTASAVCSDETSNIDLSSYLVNDLGTEEFTYTVAITGGLTAPADRAVASSANIADAITNTTDADQTVTYTVTPYSPAPASCAGNTFTVTQVIHAEPVIADHTGNTVCSDAVIGGFLNDDAGLAGTESYELTNISFGALTPAGTNQPAGTGLSATALAADSYTNTTAAPVNVVYSLVPSSADGCEGTAFTYTVTISPAPLVADVNQTDVCSDVVVGTTLATTASNGATVTSWNISAVLESGLTGTPTTGSAAGGFFNSAAVLATNSFTNTSGSTKNVEYTVTPFANGCAGPAYTITVPVKSEPLGTNGTTSTCSGTVLSYGLAQRVSVGNGGNGMSSTYQWIAADNASVTGESLTLRSTGTINDNLVNTSGSVQPVVYTVTPTSGGCAGNTFTVSVDVNPAPVGSATPPSQTVCSDASISTINFSSNVTPGTTYTWVRNNTTNAQPGATDGIAASGSGASVSGTLLNTTANNQTTTFTVTPTANGCTGATFTAAVTVQPEPVATATVADNALCSGESVSITLGTSPTLAGTTFAWTRDNTTNVTGLASSGTGNISGALNNTTSGVNEVVTFTITPTNGSCAGDPITRTVTVSPRPTVVINTIGGGDNNFCEQSTMSPTATVTTATGPFTYAWSVSGSGSLTDGTTATPSLTASIADGTTSGTGTLSLTITDANGCSNTTPASLAYGVDNTPNPGSFTSPSPICESTPVVLTQTGTNLVGTLTVAGGAADTYAQYTGAGVTNTSGSKTFVVTAANGECPDVAATGVSVQIDAQTVAGTINTLVANGNGATQTNTVCSGINTISLTLSGSTGTIQGWSVNGGSAANAGQSNVFYSNLLSDLSDSTFTYQVSVQNGQCPVQTTTATIGVFPIPEYYPVAVDVTCAGTNNGTVLPNLFTLKAGDHTPSYTYSINSGSYTASLPTNLAAGSYGLSARDVVTGCTYPQPGKPFVINAAPATVAMTDPADVLVCFGQTVTLSTTASNGSIQHTYRGGTTPLAAIADGSGTTTATVTLADDGTAYSPVVAASSIITVTLNLDHTVDSDLQVDLVGPANCGSMRLFSGIGGSGDNFIGTVLKTNASSPITSASAPFTGTFLQQGTINTASPSSVGTALAGCPVEGNWTLQARDITGNSVGGLLRGFNLSISADKGYTHSISPNVATASTSGSFAATGSYSFTQAPGTVAYTLTAADGNGCSATQTVNVTVNPAIVVSPSNPPIACAGGSTTVTVGASGGSGAGYTYAVTTGVATPSYGASNTFTLGDGTYTFWVKDGSNCENSAPLTITAPAPLMADAGLDQTVCSNSSVTVSFTPAHTGGTGAVNYSWSPSDPTNVPVVNLTNADIVTTYTLTATDANGCTATDDAVLTVRPRPDVIIAPASSPICANGAISVNATLATPGSIATIAWTGGGSYSPNNAASTSFTPASFAPAASGIATISAVVTDNFGCTSDAVTGSVDTAQITVYSPVTAGTLTPVTAVVCANTAATANLSGNSSFGNISWEVSGPESSPSPTAYASVAGTTASLTTAPLTHPQTSGSPAANYYFIRATVSNGVCPVATAETQITVYPAPLGGDAVFQAKVVDGTPDGSVIGNDSSLVCAGTGSSNNAHVIGLSGSFGTVVEWQVSIDGTNFTSIPSSANSTYTAVSLSTGLAQTVYSYRAVVQSNAGSPTCETYSDTAVIIVNPIPDFYPMGSDITCADGTGSVLFGIYTDPSNLSNFEYQIDAGAFTSVNTPPTTLVASNSTGIRIKDITSGCISAPKTFSVPEQGYTTPSLSVSAAPGSSVCPLAPVSFTATVTGGRQNIAYFNNFTPYPRPAVVDGVAPTTVPVTVSAPGGAMVTATSEIQVTLNITHEETNDLAIYLVGPANCGAMDLALNNGTGGSSGGYLATVLNTNSSNPTIGTFGTSPYTGIFKPEGTISAPATTLGAAPLSSLMTALGNLDGCPVNGVWTLYIFDTEDAATDGAVLNVGVRVVNAAPYQLTVSSSSSDAGIATATLSGSPAVFTVTPDIDATPFALNPDNSDSKTYSFSMTDGRGCVVSNASFDRTITVEDLSAPTIPSLSNVTQSTDAGLCSAVVTWSNPAITDNCTSTPAPQSVISSTPSGISFIQDTPGQVSATFPKGTTTVTYTVTDYAGNVATSSFTVTVNDNQNPSLSVPSDQTVSADAGVCTATIASGLNATFSDNCPSPVLTYTLTGVTTGSGSGQLPSTTFNKGVTTVTYTVTDASSNVATQSFTVTVNDTQAPSLSVPSNVVVSAGTGCSTTISSGLNATFGDNCPGATLAYTLTGATTGSGSGQVPTTVFNLGVTTITYTATDAGSLTTTQAFTVTVNDATNPFFDLTPNSAITAANDLSNCDRLFNSGLSVLFNDNCSISSLTYSVTGAGFATATPASGTLTFSGSTGTGFSSTGLNGNRFKVGTTTVTYTITDGSSNTANYVFTVTVNDAQNPTIFALPNITRNVDAGECFATVGTGDLTPSFFDNCTPTGSLLLTYELRTGSAAGTLFDSGSGLIGGAPEFYEFPLGTTHVKYIVKDGSNNTGTVEFFVTVVDNQAPVITGGPTLAPVSTPETACNTTVTLTAPVVTDNSCVPGSVTLSATDGVTTVTTAPYTFSLTQGTHTITWTATDASSNAATATQVVDITNEAPVIPDGPVLAQVDDFINGTGGNGCVATLTLTAPSATDACGTVVVTASVGGSPITFPYDFPQGYTTVTWTAADGTASGVTTTATQDVYIEDNVAPVFAGPLAPQSLAATGCFTTVSLPTPSVTDNGGCGTFVLTAEDEDGNLDATAPFSFLLEQGVHTITWSAEDANGNATSTTQTVTISNAAPVFTAATGGVLPAASFNVDAGSCGADQALSPAVTDDCTVDDVTATVGGSPISFPYTFPVGTTTITWTATDNVGTTATATQVVTVIDNINPTIAAPVTYTVNGSGSSCDAIVTLASLGTPVTGDNCSGTTVVATVGATPITTNYTFPLGNTTVTWTITDASGNTASATQTVTVEDNSAPVFTSATTTAAATPYTRSVTSGCTYAVTGGEFDAVATDCGSVSYELSVDGGSFAPATSADGTTLAASATAHTLAWRAMDGVNTSATVTFTVTVSDGQAPTITGGTAPVTPVCATGALTTVTWTHPTVSDNCSATGSYSIDGGIAASFTNGGAASADLAAGSHTITYTATDGANSATPVTFNVSILPGLDIAANITNINCAGELTGSIDVTVTGGSGAYTYTWTQGGNPVPGANVTVNNDLINLGFGTYDLTVTSGTCTASESFTVSTPGAPLVITTFDETQISCNGANDGAIAVSVSGGTGAGTYSFLWNDGDANEDRSGLAPGFYTLVITDGNGCNQDSFVEITEPNNLLTVSANTDQSICQGAGTALGSITTGTNGGTLTYRWLNDAPTPAVVDNDNVLNVNQLDRTTVYTLEVTETLASGSVCVKTDQVTVTMINRPAMSLPASIQACAGTPVTLVGAPAGAPVGQPTATYNYSWSGPSFSSTQREPSVSASGTYTVLVTNATVANCASTASTLVSFNATPAAGTVADEAICFGATATGLTFSPVTNTPTTVTKVVKVPTTALLDWSADPNGVLNGGSPVAITVPVTGMTGTTVTSVTASFNMASTAIGNLGVTLQAPTGSAQPLLTTSGITRNLGGSAVNALGTSSNYNLSNTGGVAITAGSADPIQGGTYNVAAMSNFVGINPNGNWTVSVSDAAVNLPAVNGVSRIDTITLTIVASRTAAPNTVTWFSGSTPVHTGSTFVPAETAAGTYAYTVQQVDPVSGCASAAQAATFTIHPEVSLAVTNPVDRCVNQFGTGVNLNPSLTGTDAQGQTLPYVVATPSALQANIQYFTTPGGMVAASTTYSGATSTTVYARVTDPGTLCSSEQPVVISINALPTLDDSRLEDNGGAFAQYYALDLYGVGNGFPAPSIIHLDDAGNEVITPTGGVYRVLGQVAAPAVVDPNITGEGVVDVSYTYAGGNLCENSIQFSIVIDDGGDFVYKSASIGLTATLTTSNAVTLNWKGIAQEDADHFMIERSLDGKQFSAVGRTEFEGTREYAFEDEAAAEYEGQRLYYRVRQVRANGVYMPSNVVEATPVTAVVFEVGNLFPNPTESATNFYIKSDKAGAALVNVYDANGREVLTQSQEVTVGSTLITLDVANLAKGAYMIRISTDNGVATRKLIVE